MPTAVIVTALPLEFLAVRAHLSGCHEEIHRSGTIYEVGTFSGEHEEWKVAIVEAGQGNAVTASEAERAISHFEPEVALFVGVAGGLKDVDLGDVVAATDVHNYERGKDESAFKPRGDVGKSNSNLIHRARAEARNADWVKIIKGAPPNRAPKVLVGPIVAGEKVVASTDSSSFRLLKQNYSHCLAVEMEGRGFLEAMHLSSTVKSLVVRGISDLVDGKSAADATGSQERAASHAAAFAFQVLSKFSVITAEERVYKSPKNVSDSTALEKLLKESESRCISTWQFLGMTKEEALSFLIGTQSSPISGQLKPTSLEPIKLVLAPIGAGKSLLGERLHQEAVKNAMASKESPWPIHLRVRPSKADFSELIESDRFDVTSAKNQLSSSGYLRPIHIIIDDAPAKESASVLELLREARFLVEVRPGSQVVILSRPTDVLEKEIESIGLPSLKWEEVDWLIGKFSNRNNLDYWLQKHSTPSVLKAVYAPLFAILFGIYLRENHGQFPSSSADILNHLVTRAFDRGQIQRQSSSFLLQKLAISILNDAQSVLWVDLFTRKQLDELLATGLIIQEGRRVRFFLDVLTEWFGHEALLNQVVDVGDFLENSRRLISWLPSLGMFISEGSEKIVSPVLSRIVSEDPGFASVLIGSNLTKSKSTGNPPAFTECSERIQKVMNAWVTGLGPLSTLICPTDLSGQVRTLGGCTARGQIAYGWGVVDNSEQLSSEWPIEVITDSNSTPWRYVSPRDWAISKQGPISDHSTWAWGTVHQEIRRNMYRLLSNREFPLTDGVLRREIAWHTALQVMNFVPGRRIPIPLEPLSAVISQRLEEGHYQIEYPRRVGKIFDLEALGSEIEKLREAGFAEMTMPWPSADQYSPKGWIIKGSGRKEMPPAGMSIQTAEKEHWSALQVRNKVEFVLQAALENFEMIVEMWLPTIKHRMNLCMFLPARLVGFVTSAELDPSGSYGVTYYFEPLPQGSKSFADVMLDQPVPEREDIQREVWRRIGAYRPHAAGTLISSIASRGAFLLDQTPVHDLVYQWLEEDLKRLEFSSAYGS